MRWRWETVAVVIGLAAAACSSGESVPPAPAWVPDPVPATSAAPSAGPTRSTAAETAAQLASWCRAARTTTLGTVRVPELTEISGLVAGRRDASIVWAHNDSGGASVVYALGLDGARRGSARVTGVAVTDWEDIAIGPGPVDAAPWLHVADIGDNGLARRSVHVVRFAEPSLARRPDSTEPALPADATATVTVTGDAVELTYPDAPHDAEAFFVHPVSGDWYVLTKEATRSSVLFRAPRPGPAVRQVVLEVAGHLDVRPDRVTAADLSPDGTRLAVRSYLGLRVFAVTGDDVAGALGEAPCRLTIADEWQGESIAFAADGRSLLSVSEGTEVALHRTG